MKKTSSPVKQQRPAPAPEQKVGWKPLPTIVYPILYSIFFAALASVFLLGRNADLLFFMQDRDWWTSTGTFWDECMRVPGGLLSWAGAYLTQFFYQPWLGTMLLVALWLATFGVARCSFRLRDEWSLLLYLPMAALLCSIIQLGYWVYFLKEIDYIFYHSLGLFAAIVLSFDYARFLPDRGRLREAVSVALILVAALCYWLLGFYALVAITFIVVKTLHRDPSHRIATRLTGLAAIALAPYLFTKGCTNMRPDQPWTFGFRFFEIAMIRDKGMELPFGLAVIFPLFFPLLQRLGQGALSKLHTRLSLLAMAAVGGGMVWCASSYDFTDYNFHAEMRMQRAVEEQRWQDVLREARIAPGAPTREMMMFRDIALINCDDIGSVRYTYNNEGIPPATASDSIYTRIRDQAADLIYYNLGETTFAIRRSIERSMHFGYGYYIMRMLVRCALVNGEEQVAQKYLNLLAKTTFHRKWAREMMPLAKDRKLVEQDERFRVPLHLYRHVKDQIGTDHDYIETGIIDKLAHTASEDPFTQSVALYYSMINKNPQTFFAQLLQYLRLNPGKPIPLHYQEAAWLYATQAGYNVRQYHGIGIEQLPISEVKVKQRMARFFQFIQQYASQGLSDRQIGQLLRPEFGDTFWWYYCVIPEEHTN